MYDDETDVRAKFTSSELAQIDAATLPYGENVERNAIHFALGWQDHVDKLDRDRSLPRTDRSVWNEYDLVAALYIRDRVDTTKALLPPALAEKLQRSYVDISDERFRSFTVEDPGTLIAWIADKEMPPPPVAWWWWYRVPTSGPIVEDLADQREYREAAKAEGTA